MSACPATSVGTRRRSRSTCRRADQASSETGASVKVRRSPAPVAKVRTIDVVGAGAGGLEGEARAVGRIERARLLGGVGDEEVGFAAGWRATVQMSPPEAKAISLPSGEIAGVAREGFEVCAGVLAGAVKATRRRATAERRTENLVKRWECECPV